MLLWRLSTGWSLSFSYTYNFRICILTWPQPDLESDWATGGGNCGGQWRGGPLSRGPSRGLEGVGAWEGGRKVWDRGVLGIEVCVHGGTLAEILAENERGWMFSIIMCSVTPVYRGGLDNSKLCPGAIEMNSK